MKEKTFEELIKEHKWYDRADYAKKEPLLDKSDVLKLLQQVREATIAECKDKIWNEYGICRKATEIEAEFESLPTDRIKTEK